MPAPAAPTSLTLTQPRVGDPTVTLAWSHTGTDLDRFQVLFRTVGATYWKSYVLAPKADFNPSGTSYSLVVATPESAEWAVRALNSSGEVST